MANDTDVIIKVSLKPTDIDKANKQIQDKAKKTGEVAGKSLEQGFGKSIAALRATAIGALAGIAAAFSVKAVVNAARAQEDAISALNKALLVTGQYNESTSRSFQDFASSLQSVSRVGDEAILKQLAIAKSLGATDEQAKKILSTAIDLSEALGISLDSAVLNLTKTLSGNAGQLGKLLPQIKNLTAEQLKAGVGVDLVSKKFDGQGKNINTFSFTMDRLNNVFGDVLESVGEFIIKNQALIGILQGATKYLDDFAGGLRGIQALLGVQGAAVNELEEVERKIAKLVDTSTELNQTLEKRKKGGFLGIVTAGDRRDIEEIPKRLQALDGELKKLVDRRKELLDEQRKNKDASLAISQQEVKAELTNAQLIAQAKLQNSTIIIEDANLRLEALRQLRDREFLSESEYQLQILELRRTTDEQLKQLEDAQRDRAIETSGSIRDATVAAFNDIQVSTVALGQSLRDLALNGFGRSMQAIGAALATGSNANEAFVNSVKQTASEAASAFGDYYIKLGVARVAAGDPSGGAIIAGGAALKVLSGALGASAGASKAGGTSGIAVGNGQFADIGALSDPQQTRREERSSVNLTIQGDVFDSEESGLRIGKLISEAAGKTGVVLRDASFA
jgi:hypothetical protein